MAATAYGLIKAVDGVKCNDRASSGLFKIYLGGEILIKYIKNIMF